MTFGDDYGIAESGNGIPDLLDEIKWSLDWIVRMQSGDGSLLCVMGLASASPPSAANGPANGITFRPLYEVHHQRYSVYWTLK